MHFVILCFFSLPAVKKETHKIVIKKIWIIPFCYKKNTDSQVLTAIWDNNQFRYYNEIQKQIYYNQGT